MGTTPGASDVWDSGRVASTENGDVPYAGPPRDRASGCYWRVRTWDAGGAPSDWWAAAHFGRRSGRASRCAGTYGKTLTFTLSTDAP